MWSLTLDRNGYPVLPYGDEFPAAYPDYGLFYRIDTGKWYTYRANTKTWTEASFTIEVNDGTTSVLPAIKITFDGSYLTVTDSGSGEASVAFDETSIDHGNLGGLGDDDHPHYLKEKLQGGTAAELPIHDHSGAGEGGAIDHSAYLQHDGSVALTVDWDAGSFDITAEQLVADSASVAEGVVGGAAFIGNFNGGATHAVFCSAAQRAVTKGYAIRQSPDGHTYVNAAASKHIVFCVQNIEKFRLSGATGHLSFTNVDLLSINDITGSGGSIFSGGSGAGEDLYLFSTTHATHGKIYLGANDYYDEVNEDLRINTANTASKGVYAGNAYVGTWSNTGYASFYGAGLTPATEYALIQSTSTGQTILNTKSGTTLSLRVANSQVLGIAGASISAAQNLDMNANIVYDCTELRGPDAGGDLYVRADNAGDNLRLHSTRNATKGNIYLGANDYYDEVNEELHINTADTLSKGVHSGPAFIGPWTVNTNACFYHDGMTPATEYALKQDSAGETVLNSKTGQFLELRIANVVKFRVAATYLAAQVALAMGGNYISNVCDIYGNGGTKIHGGQGSGDNLELYSTQHGTKGTINIGVDGSNVPLGSTTSAPIMPSMTTVQRDALTAVVGMIVYNTTTGVIEGYEGAAWVNL